jgi:glucokinase
MILAGDIGGTNTRLGCFTESGGQLRLQASETFSSGDYDSLDCIVQTFMARHRGPGIGTACLAIAGPVHDGKVSTTNLAWSVDADRLQHQLEIPSVTIINDLEAIAYAIPYLAADDLQSLNTGVAETGNLAIIAAGTGLGQAAAYWDDDQRRHRPFACEGGHVDFAPRNDLESQLLRFLLKRFQRVSYERILSGSGLFAIYEFLDHSGQGDEDPALTETLYRQQHPGPIVRAALDGRSQRCSLALDLFVSLYGAEAGNLALKLLARGGVYLAGGIAPRIIERLRHPAFLESFQAKGRMRPLLEAMPVHVIVNDKAGLWGAARHAANHRSGAGTTPDSQ